MERARRVKQTWKLTMQMKPQYDNSNGVRDLGKSIWRLEKNIKLNLEESVAM